MTRVLDPSEASAARALARDLSVIDLEGPSVARWLGPRVQSLLGVESTLIYTPERVDGGFQLREFALTGIGGPEEAAIRRGGDAHMRSTDGVWSLYDPVNVEPIHRNRVLAVDSVRAVSERGLPALLERAIGSRQERDRRLEAIHRLRRWYERWGTVDTDTLRIILCDGHQMIGWVGGMQHGRFSRTQHALMSALVGPMQRRFALEERLGSQGFPAMLVPALLEEIAGPAYVLDGKQRVVAMNTQARGALGRNARGAERLREAAVRGGDPDLTVVDLASRGVPRHSLLIERTNRPPGADAARATAKRYLLTPRELEVLMHLGRGHTNRAIAVALGCGERTVETHVSRILGKTDCASRSELLALVWSEATR
jgi:DNA-binding CsgD family transcriptional regulator